MIIGIISTTPQSNRYVFVMDIRIKRINCKMAKLLYIKHEHINSSELYLSFYGVVNRP